MKGMAQAGALRAVGSGDDLDVAEMLGTIALSSPIASRLNSEVLRYVARASKAFKSKAGERILSRDERTYGMILVLRGLVGAEVPTDGGAVLVETFGPGEFCAAEPLANDMPALTTLRAQCETWALMIPYGVARILCARNSAIAELVAHRSQLTNVTAVVAAAEGLRCDAAALADLLLPEVSFVSIPARQCILAENVVSDTVYLLGAGTVDVTVPHPKSGYLDYRRERCGALFGRSSLLGQAENAAAWTATDCNLLQVPRRSLEQCLRCGVAEITVPTPSISRAQAA